MKWTRWKRGHLITKNIGSTWTRKGTILHGFHCFISLSYVIIRIAVLKKLLPFRSQTDNSEKVMFPSNKQQIPIIMYNTLHLQQVELYFHEIFSALNVFYSKLINIALNIKMIIIIYRECILDILKTRIRTDFCLNRIESQILQIWLRACNTYSILILSTLCVGRIKT